MVPPEWTGLRVASSVANLTTPRCLLVTSFERVLVWILKAALQIQQHWEFVIRPRQRQAVCFVHRDSEQTSVVRNRPLWASFKRQNPCAASLSLVYTIYQGTT